ncbi:MAG: NAD(P)H-dependent oxidoreductase [Pseudomonadota bacterium]
MSSLLLICHAPSPNTSELRDAALAGAKDPDLMLKRVECLAPAAVEPEHVRSHDGIVIGTTENFASMAGLTKDFFERIYYPCLQETQGKPVVVYVRAGEDGTGTRQQIEKILTGLRWRLVQPVLVLKGGWQRSFVPQVKELSATLAAGLEAGIF